MPVAIMESRYHHYDDDDDEPENGGRRGGVRGGRLVVSDGFLMSLLGRLVWHGTYGTLSGFTSCPTVKDTKFALVITHCQGEQNHYCR